MGPERSRSFGSILRATVLWMVLPLAALLIVNSLYSIRAFNRRLAESNQRTVDACVWQIEDQLAAIDDALIAIVASNLDFRTLSGGASQLQSYLASYALYQQLKPLAASYTVAKAFFIYSHTSGVQRDIFIGDFEYQHKRHIQNFVREAVAQDQYAMGMGWNWVRIEDAVYLLRFYGSNGTYLAALVPLDQLVGITEWE